MPQYLSERSLTRSKSRRWKQIKGSTLSLIGAILALTVCAWVFLVFGARRHCIHEWHGSPLSMFPWEPMDLLDPQVSDRTAITLSKWPRHSLHTMEDLNISHLLFGIAGSAKLWPRRKEYVKLWWQPAEMRGFVWLEEFVESEPDELLPEVQVSENISRFSYMNPTGDPSGIRIARIVQEAFKLNLRDVRWFIMGDDDTVFDTDNLLQVLRKYDHREMYYIGNPSESHSSNTYFSHGMAFGGGGIAISFSLAEALSNTLDECLERYPFLFGSDDRLHACITELGVPLTKEPGFHQFDVHGDAFGLLAAHPIAPFISIHHLDELDPVFPHYNALDGLHHLTKAMQVNPSGFLQRSICYDHTKRLTFSISLGYVVQVYPYVLLPRDLERPEITFKAWNKKNGRGEFDFDTRMVGRSCKRPFLFYLKVIYNEGPNVVSVYERNVADTRRRWFCFSHASQREAMQQIRVVTRPLNERWFKVPRRQCCKIMGLHDQELGVHMGSCQQAENGHQSGGQLT